MGKDFAREIKRETQWLVFDTCTKDLLSSKTISNSILKIHKKENCDSGKYFVVLSNESNAFSMYLSWD